MEQKFDINKVIAYYDLKPEDVADVCFPEIRYKTQALGRLLSGEAKITVDQVQAIANLAGVLPQDLFAVDTWHGGYEDSCLVFVRGQYKAKLNYKGAFLTVYKNNDIITQEVNGNNMPVFEFIQHINKIIENDGSKS